MFWLLIKQFFRSKVVFLTLSILLFLGGVSIMTGKQFLDQKNNAIAKTKEQYQKHIDNQVQLHKDDLGLLMYYLKFSLINPVEPIASISIGLSDVNSNVQTVKILNLEGQKYDTDLVNPMRLQVGNLDFSFLIIYLFPLIIISLTFNVLSEEVEKGTWKIIRTQGRQPYQFLIMKYAVRVVFIFLILAILFLMAKVVLAIPLNKEFIYFILISYLYVLFWFLLCFLITIFKKTSKVNATTLLVSWLLIVVFIPMLINDYVVNRYPIEEAYSLTVNQRDKYHQKWDTDKKETLQKFYRHYPQFTKFGFKENGFSWLWYYAMQQMGDDESKEEKEAMQVKIRKRKELSEGLAKFVPPLQVQLTMNSLAKTSLNHHIKFLEETTKFHENIRLYFYPKIFDNISSSTINWTDFKPEKIKNTMKINVLSYLMPIALSCTILLFVIFFFFRIKPII